MSRLQAGYGYHMLALIALICFLLALFKVSIESVDLVTLGFVFLAAHLVFGGGFYPAVPRFERR